MRSIGVLLACWLGATTFPVAAEPDFSTSKTDFQPSPVMAGDVLRYDVAVANTGSGSSYARVKSELPPGYLIRAEADCARATLDQDRRSLVWHEGAFPAGTTKRCVVHLLTRRETSGTSATLATEINAPPGFYRRFEASPTLMSPPDPDAIALGPVMITRAGCAVLGGLAVLLGGIVVVVRMARRRGGQAALAARGWTAIIVAVGFLAYFATLARGDVRTYTAFRATSCTIFDATVRAIEPSDASESSATYAPMFAVRYDALGQETFSSGYASLSSVSFGWIGPSRQALERFSIGSIHPCWYDPKDAKTVLLERGPGAAYLFALLPLPVLALGLHLLTGALGRRREPA